MRQPQKIERVFSFLVLFIFPSYNFDVLLLYIFLLNDTKLQCSYYLLQTFLHIANTLLIFCVHFLLFYPYLVHCLFRWTFWAFYHLVLAFHFQTILYSHLQINDAIEIEKYVPNLIFYFNKIWLVLMIKTFSVFAFCFSVMFASTFTITTNSRNNGVLRKYFFIQLISFQEYSWYEVKSFVIFVLILKNLLLF